MPDTPTMLCAVVTLSAAAPTPNRGLALQPNASGLALQPKAKQTDDLGCGYVLVETPERADRAERMAPR